MLSLSALDPLHFYGPKEVRDLFGQKISVNWIRTQVKDDPTLGTRHTGRSTLVFTAEQVLRLHALVGRPGRGAVTPLTAPQGSHDIDPAATAIAPEGTHGLLRTTSPRNAAAPLTRVAPPKPLGPIRPLRSLHATR